MILYQNKQTKNKMAIAYNDIYTNFGPIHYNGTNLPYGITMPILNFTDEDPPCSPRPDGEVEVRPRIICHLPTYSLYYVYFPTSTSDMKIRQHKFSKYPSKKNMNKIFRKTHKLKQPGGASCNQRR